MTTHFAHVVELLGRAAAECTCGQLQSPERFGDRAASLARVDVEAHLEEVARLSGEWVETDLGFVSEASLDDFSTCPTCHDTLDLLPDSLGIVACVHGHSYDVTSDGSFVFLTTQQKLREAQVHQAAAAEQPLAVIDLMTDYPNCPLCGSVLLGTSDELVGLQDDHRFVISCVRGHEFDMIKHDLVTIYLFASSPSSDGPFVY